MFYKVRYIFDRRQKRNFIILFVLITIGAMLEMLGVSAILPLVNLVMEPKMIENSKWFEKIGEIFDITTPRQFIVLASISLIIIYIIKNIYLIFMYSIQYRFTYNNQRRIAKRLMECYMKQDYLYHLHKSSAELIRNINTDVNQFFCVILNILQLCTELLTCVALVTFLAVQDFFSTLSVMAILLVFLCVFYIFFKRYSYILGEENRIVAGKLNQCMLQSFEGIKETKVFNKENFFIKQYDKTYEVYSKLIRKQNMRNTIPKPIIESMSICGLLSVLSIRICFGGDLESFIPVLSVFAFSAFRMLPSFNRITVYINTIMFNKASVDAVYNDLKEVELLLAKSEESEENVFELEMKDSIEVEHVTFCYPKTEKKVLKDVSLSIPKCCSIALIGQSGAGKTTLADVIMGLLKPTSGKILVDGIDIYEHMNAWHKVLGYIPQTIYLMDDSIASNIAYGIEEIDEVRLWKAIKDAQLEEFIREQPDGVNTVVGERGIRLSGGQRQRIGIARALYCDPSVLVLDEATSALDNDTEKAVMEAITHLQGKKTMIIIAHRLSTIKNCDKIYEVSDGSVNLRSKESVFLLK